MSIGRKYNFYPIINSKVNGINYKKACLHTLSSLWLNILMVAVGGLTIDYIKLNKSEYLWGIIKSVK